MRGRSSLTATIILLWMMLAGCGSEVQMKPQLCTIVLERGEGFTAPKKVQTAERGSNVEFLLTMEEGYQFLGTDYGAAEQKHRAAVGKDMYGIRYCSGGRQILLTLYDVKYSESIKIETQKSDREITYHANGGELLQEREGHANTQSISIVSPASHLRPNTAIGTELFERKGYTLTGWNTKADGSGEQIGFGSRCDWKKGMELFAQWVPWTEESYFEYKTDGRRAVITGYTGKEEVIGIPPVLGGCSVYRIASYAFQNVDCKQVILPAGLYEVEKWAFQGAALEELYLYDDLRKISDYAFQDCSNFRTLHINAIERPVYSGNYFDTFQDKYDRLRSLKGKKKIVLFSGSSTRFGYDSARIKEAFPQYEVVNMGVFAYTPALPQMLLILECMDEEDLLIHAPEFDASNRQFCSQKELDYAVFAMMESNYDAFARLDIREFSQVFTAFTAYNAGREDMEKRSYWLSALNFDEDGNAVTRPSYNEYGDYILYRPNAEDEQPVYGLPVNYTVNAFPMEQYLDPINEMYQRFLDRGVSVYFSYAPRNIHALSAESTKEERQRLHRYFKENLIVPVLGELEDSLYPGTYLYGTDNHLSTEGVQIRTQKVIEELEKQLEQKKLPK